MGQRFRIARILLWPLRIAVAVTLLAGVTLAGVIGWLSGKEGSQYVRQLIRDEVSPAIGYKLEVQDLAFALPLTARLRGVSLADGKGVWLKADDIAIALLPTPTMHTHLIVRSIDIGTLEVLRQPETATSSGDNGGSDSSPIDVSLLRLEVGTLSLAPALTGLQETLPLALQVRAGYAGRQEVLSLSGFSITHPQGSVTGKGTVDLKEQALDIGLESGDIALEPLSDALTGHIRAQAQVSGGMDGPAFTVTLHSRDIAYDTRPVPDAVLQTSGTVRGSDVTGTLSLAAGEGRELAARYALSGDRLTIEDLKAGYDGNQMDGHAAIDTATLLADGTLSLSLPSLAVFSDMAGMTLAGGIRGDISLSSTAGRQAAKLLLEATGLETPHVNLRHATLDAQTGDVLRLMPDDATLTLSQLQADGVSVAQARLSAKPNGKAWQVTLDADGTAGEAFSLHSAGALTFNNAQDMQLALASLKARYGAWPLSAQAPVVIASREATQSIDAPKLTVAGGQYALAARRTAEHVSLSLNGQNIRPAEFQKNLPEQLASSVATLALTVEGSPQQPQATADITLAAIRLHPSAPPARLIAGARTQGGKLHITGQLQDAAAITSSASAALPLTFSLEPFALDMAQDAPLDGKAQLSLDIAALSGLLVPPPHLLTGNVNGAVSLGGTPAAPTVSGAIDLSRGSYRHPELGVALHNISAHLDAARDRFTLSRFTAEDSKGNKLTGDGKAGLAGDGVTYDASFHTDGLELFQHPNLHGMFAIDLSIRGDAKEGTLHGAIGSKEMEIRLPDRFVGSVPELNVVQTVPSKKRKTPANDGDSPAYPLLLDITFTADNKVFVRGWDVDAEFAGALAIRGNAAAPDIQGKLATIRGRYEEFGKQFQIKTGELLFEGSIPPAPYLNIVTSIHAGDAEIRPVITGPAMKPSLAIESTPDMAQEDALSLLLFGKDSKKISAFQAAQLAASVRRLSGEGGGFDPVGQIRDMIGVDDVSVKNDGGDSTSPSVGVGKYIGDNIYLEVERGAEATSGKARVEIEVTPSVSVESATGAAGQSSVGLNWKRDY